MGKLKHGAFRGDVEAPTHKTWRAMISRCYDARNLTFPQYGARGIVVCQRWRDSYEAFVLDMGERPSREHTIDRIDNARGYEPGNCRWATQAEQQRNRTNNIRHTIGERTLCLKEWCAEFGVRYDMAHTRVIRRGWSVEQALGLKPAPPRCPEQLKPGQRAALEALANAPDGLRAHPLEVATNCSVKKLIRAGYATRRGNRLAPVFITEAGRRRLAEGPKRDGKIEVAA